MYHFSASKFELNTAWRPKGGNATRRDNTAPAAARPCVTIVLSLRFHLSPSTVKPPRPPMQSEFVVVMVEVERGKAEAVDIGRGAPLLALHGSYRGRLATLRYRIREQNREVTYIQPRVVARLCF